MWRKWARAATAVAIVGAMGCSGTVQTSQTARRPKDADSDGIRDDHDECVGQREDGLPPDRRDGCTSQDPDGDSITGAADRCPLVAETKNGNQDDDGCPDAKVAVSRLPRVTVTKTEIKIDDKILFAFGKAAIDDASDGLLKEIAEVMNANPQVEFVEVAGHADRVGSDPINVNLTKRRAEAVVEALRARGVDPKRMRPQGYGRYCPIDPDETDAAREKNRRVEFKILRVGGVDTGVAVGCPAAAARGIKPPIASR